MQLTALSPLKVWAADPCTLGDAPFFSVMLTLFFWSNAIYDHLLLAACCDVSF